MRAITYTAAGDPDVIQLREVPTPEPEPGQIRVRVHAAGLNRADMLQRRGRYPTPPGWPADIPGMEYAGEVEKLGVGVTRWRIGDRVMGLVGGGAHAEFVVVHQDETLSIPEGMSFTDAAAIPEAFLTAWDAGDSRPPWTWGSGAGPRRRERSRHGGNPDREAAGRGHDRHFPQRREARPRARVRAGSRH